MTEFIEQVFSTIFGNHVILATILISVVPIIEIKGAIPFAMSKDIWGIYALTNVKATLFALIGSCAIVPILALIYIPIINWLKKTKLFRSLAIKIENKVNRSKNKIENKAQKSLDLAQTEDNVVTIKNNENSKNSVNNGLKLEPSEQQNKNNEQINQNITKENEGKKNSKNKLKFNKVLFIKMLCVFLFVCVPLPLTGVWTGTCVAVVLGLGLGWTCLSVILGNIVAGVLVCLVSSIPGFDSIYIVYAVLIFVVCLILFGVIKSLVNKNKAKN